MCPTPVPHFTSSQNHFRVRSRLLPRHLSNAYHIIRRASQPSFSLIPPYTPTAIKMLTLRPTDPFLRPSHNAKMNSTQNTVNVLPHALNSHPHDPIPQDPELTRKLSIAGSSLSQSVPSTTADQVFSDDGSSQGTTSTTHSDSQSDDSLDELQNVGSPENRGRKRRASTILVSQNSDDVHRLLGQSSSSVEMIQKACCGGGCCRLQELKSSQPQSARVPVQPPNNTAYRALNVRLSHLGLESELSGLVDLPPKVASFEQIGSQSSSKTYADPRPQHPPESQKHPPNYVKPHPPYDVYSAPLYHARELTKSGAEKRTYHFDLDVTDYPEEGGDVEFVVGGAIGVCAPNDPALVNGVLDRLGIPRFIRGQACPTQDNFRSLANNLGRRRSSRSRNNQTRTLDLVLRYPELPSNQATIPPPCRTRRRRTREEDPTVPLLRTRSGRILRPPNRTLHHLTTTPHRISILKTAARPPPFESQPTHAPLLLPLSRPPRLLRAQWSGLQTHHRSRRYVHETTDYDGTQRTGVGSGFLERLARKSWTLRRQESTRNPLICEVPMFRGLMANPLAREFVSDGPCSSSARASASAPFRGFVHRRLKSANCANKVWVLQGVRDSLLDELYSGDWGVHEEKVKKVVQSRRGEGRYVQEEVRAQADLVWFIINALDGRVFVCGSSKGMGEGVEKALVDVAMGKGGLNEEEARAFWAGKREGGQYIAETW